MPWLDLEAEIHEEFLSFAGAIDRKDNGFHKERGIQKLLDWIAANPVKAKVARARATRKWYASLSPEKKERQLELSRKRWLVRKQRRQAEL